MMSRMILDRLVLTVGLLSAAAGHGQGPDQPKFEVASIKAATQAEFHRVAWQQDFGGKPGRLFYADVTLQELVGHAYRLKESQIDGPSWITTNRYDIEAIPPADAPREKYPEMLQHLLSERFGLVVHKSQKQRTVYALQVGTTQPKLRRATADERRSMIMSISDGQIRLAATAATMDDLAHYLMSNARKLEGLVLNKTGLEGEFDFTLEWLPDSPLTLNGNVAGGEGAAGVSIFGAVQQQLGLKLASQKASVEFLVVDRAEKTPTAN
jgi:uncharacterized protein (TIGR03435 family)